MEIKTKYNLGDMVWVIDRNKPVYMKITRVIITEQLSQCNGSIRRYHSIVYSGERTAPHDEKNCYQTKEELINSMWQESQRSYQN